MTGSDIQTDIIIFGGGVAGLWLLNALSQRGFSCLLCENNALGAGQSGVAQGIIHGGIKYSLHGLLDPSTRAIADMPQRWQQHFRGERDINLSQVKILSPAHYLWSQQRLSTRISHFLTSKALTCPGTLLKRSDYPAVFAHDAFQGFLTRVDETVVDPQSLIHCLTKPYLKRIIKIHKSKPPTFQTSADNTIQSVTLYNDQVQPMHARAQLYVFAAGAGNENLLAPLSNTPTMQRRPLHMVSLSTKHLDPLFAHYVGADGQPKITITSHTNQHGDSVWYCGGQIAEQGIHRTPADQIKFTQALLADCLPWIDLSHAQWHSFFIDRAEIAQPNHKRPVSFFSTLQHNYIVTWPTKLALTPAMADHVLQCISGMDIKPHMDNIEAVATWPRPAFSQPAWSFQSGKYE